LGVRESGDERCRGFPVDRLILLTGLLLRKHIRRPP
jgi:hypothetical protein